ncbi:MULTISPECIES: hypothetical protein [Bacillus cereus group]|uniref:Type VII secretion protein EssB n=6 Tax=Bacillus cereus group TaxID=86661 RepID=A0A1W6WYR1_BACTU|nr:MULTISPECIES: hypothetical protein [Bacillus cereus group]EOP80561.1 hypothetical protein IES_06347 [Bacillus cereus BMG1.7]AEA19233.1 hypothetical protein CT43_P127051 [Bacillus thuringiensis serovar chinensis CT-43]AGE81570.1 hypothetical protein HD73_7014 [Bacillus thuringiensis serovar kurstaki str. HD73]AGG04762.1 hypothetical protein H175_107p038 [Bacillus thuringiensis serovar thuringiensis str. IS5056]AHZ55163.1 hypothetical protein YBT1520_32836 [Bacillus thuringiensis serovar kurs
MRVNINKLANIEIEDNTLKYRIPITELNQDDLNIIEKNLKRKIQSIDNDPHYLVPFEMQILNASLILYYDMEKYKSFEYLRSLEFSEQLKYFSSMIQIAKNSVHTKTLWNKYNFVLDEYEDKMKVVIYETTDLKIYDIKDSLIGVKELILLSLTKLTQIYGKPRRTDFIDPSDEIIQFAETLLQIDDLEDLDHFVNTKMIQSEHFEPEETEVEEEKVTKDKKWSLKLKSNKNDIKKREKKQQQQKKKKKNNSKKTYIILGSVIILAIGLNFALTSLNDSKSAEKNKQNAKKQYHAEVLKKNKLDNKPLSQDEKDKLFDAYQTALIGENQKAIESLENIGYENLRSVDQQVLDNLYKKTDQVYKLFDKKPSLVKGIVNEMLANNKGDELLKIQEKMESKSPYVDFEVAYINKDWKKVVELKDEVDLNGRREKQIVEAFTSLKKYKEAKDFAQKVGNPVLLEEIKAFSE